jgi:hypothetical protein
MAVRLGEPSLSEVLADLHPRTARLEETALTAPLAAEPDNATIETFLLAAYQRHWATQDA